MLSIKELAQQLAVFVNGEYTGFGESSYDTLGMKAPDSDHQIPTSSDVNDVGVKSILVEYNTTQSTTLPESGWVTDEPKNIENPFWSRITITRPDGEVKRFVSFSGGGFSGGGGSGGAGAIGSVSYKLPDIVDGSSYTEEQLNYWKNKFYPIIEKDLLYAKSSSDKSPVTIDTPVTKTGVLYETSTYSDSYTSIAIRVRYRGINPNINKSIVPPGVDRIFADIMENDSGYEIVQCRVRDVNGDVWEGFIDHNTPTRPKTVVGNKFKYGTPCFTSDRYNFGPQLVVTREIDPSILQSATAVDYSDATTDYNDETPFAYVIPKGDTILTFDNTTGLYNYTGSGDVIIQPYVGRWKAPLFYIDNGYPFLYTRPADITVKPFSLPTMIVPTISHPGTDVTDRLNIFQSKQKNTDN